MKMTKDEEYLNILSIFHYVVACMVALLSCIPILYLIFGLILLFVPDAGPEKVFAVFLILFPLVFILAGWTFAGLLAYAGMSVRQRTRHTFCVVMAALSCMFFPFGTALGVFTIIVLVKPEVKELFGVAETGAAETGVAPPLGGVAPPPAAGVAPPPGGGGPDDGGMDRSGKREA